MLKFTRRLLAATRQLSGRSRRGRKLACAAPQALEDRCLMAADWFSSTADPSQQVFHHTALVSEGEGEAVGLTVQFTDVNGNPITSIAANQDFQVRVFTEDLRDVSTADAGVVTAYMSLLFDTSLVTSTGPVTFSDDYDFFNSPGSVGNGEIADFFAATNFFDFDNPLGFGEKLFAIAPFRTNSAGSLGITANNDTLGASGGANTLDVLANDTVGGSALFMLDRSNAVGAEINLFDQDDGASFAQEELDPDAGNIAYGQGSLGIEGAGTGTITAVGSAANGTVTISGDGQNVVYTPASGFTGEDSFTYTVTGSGGETSTATATVNVTAAAPDLVQFAKDLAEADVKFFGAVWCPFCSEQKELFQDGAKYLPFIEVTNSDRSLNDTGELNEIDSFPTWVFPNGTRREEVLTLEEISQLSGVPIPQGNTPHLAELPNVTVLDGAPLHVALDGYDPNGGPLTYTVTSSNPNVVTPTLLTGNRSMLIDMAGYENMLFQLFDDRVQSVTDVIASLAENDTYDDVIFHRVINGFVIQGGDPTGTGTGDPSIADFDDQFHFDLQHVQTGLLSMAKSGDDTNSSQFFITEGPSRHLDFNHSVFGILVEGESAREGISNTAVGAGDVPINTVRMNSVEIFEDTENGAMMLKAVPGATGTSDITVTVSDGEGNTFQRTFTVTVAADTSNGAPFLAEIPEDITTTVNTPVDIELEGLDIEGDPVVFSAVATGSVTGTQVNVNNTTGVVTVTPPAGFVGTLQVRMEVEPENWPGDPSQIPFDSQVVEITVLDLAAPTGIDLLNTTDTGVSPTDDITSASSLEFEISGVAAGNLVQVLRGTTVVGQATAAGDTVVVTVDLDSTLADGDYQFTAIQVDEGLPSAATAPLALTIDRTLPLDFTSTPPTDLAAGTELVFDIQNGSETGLTYALVTQGVTGVTVDPDTGELRWSPTTAQEGPQSLTVRVADAAGNTRDQVINLTVQNADLPAFSDAYEVDEDGTLTVNAAGGVLANDNESDTEGLTAAVVDDAANGTLTFNADGSFTYTPDANFHGADSFTYTFTDGEGTSNEAMVVITVNNLNDPPTAVDDAYTVVEDGALNIAVGEGLLANDTDPDGDNDTLTAAVLAGPANGTLTLNGDGAFVYDPNDNFSGTDSFTYTVSDGNGGASTGTVTLTVTSVNDPPVAVNDSYTVNEDGTLTIDAEEGVLANDTDLEDNDLNGLLISNVTNGTLTFNAADGSFTYTPNANFSGTDTFTYRANDNTINSANIATVTITVAAQNDAPTAVNDTATVFRNAANQRVDVLANDTDPDSDTLEVTAVGTGSQGGTLTIIENGAAVAYTPAADFSGAETFTYTVTDAGGATTTATLTMTVEEFSPGSLAGFAYIDANNNGVFDGSEVALGGITVTLTGTANDEAVNRTATTASDGSYTFNNLAPGNYTITQTQPLFLIDGRVTAGSQGGTTAANVITTTLAEGIEGTANNFGEMGRHSSTASMHDWFSSTPTDGIFTATNTTNGQLWYYVESGWSGDPVVDFELDDDLDSGTLTVDYADSDPQTITLDNGAERHFTVYASQTANHFVRIHGNAASAGVTVDSSSTSGDESEGESEGESLAAAAVADDSLAGEGEAASFMIDVLADSSLSSEGEAEEAKPAAADEAIDQAILDLDERTIAEQSADSAVDAALEALAADGQSDDADASDAGSSEADSGDDLEELLETLATE